MSGETDAPVVELEGAAFAYGGEPVLTGVTGEIGRAHV